MVRITEDDILDVPNSPYELILEAIKESIKADIKANSIVINRNLVKVPEAFGQYPAMICGLKCHFTSNDLPDDYLFSVLHDSRPMTNADRIRAMTDEELKAFLIDVDLNKAGSPFITEWGEWLKQPAEK